MEDLPLIPGYTFKNSCIHDHKINPKLDYANGCRVVRDSFIGNGRRPVDAASSAYAQANFNDVLEYDPSLTYGRSKGYACKQVIPHYALFAQKCLNFKAFFRQSVYNSPVEHFRIRHVNIVYFLEDDTMWVIEPAVDNAGFPQGKLVRRGKIPKDDSGRFYHWKDLNVGIDIPIYGVVYHTVDCDTFTAEYLRSQGIDPGDREEPPPDSYTQERLAKLAAIKSPVNAKKSRSMQDDPRRRFLEFDGMILTFDATWNEDIYQILYFLTDDTISVKEMLQPNSGKDPNRMLLKRTKIPKNWTDLPVWYPSIYLERSDEEVVEYYNPRDFKIGETIFIFGRRFFLYDCDAFTRRYFCNMLGLEQPPRISPSPSEKINRACNNRPMQKHCVTFSDKPKSEDVIRKIFNHPKKLRYLMSMIAVHPEDEGREFILEYSLSDGMIKINEVGRTNSGRRGGCFLSSMLVPKERIKPTKDCDEEVTIYYTPVDFFIGAKINVFSRRFLITGADLFILKYVEANSDKFPGEIVQNIRDFFNKNSRNSRESCGDAGDEEGEKRGHEPLLAVKKEDEALDAEKIISNLPESRSENPCDYDRGNEGLFTPKKITWADQVQVPCTVTNNNC